NAVVFAWQLGLDDPALWRVVTDLGVVPARFTGWTELTGRSPLDPARFLPLVTSMFLHGGWLHALGNLWFLWIFGDNVEDRLGRAGFLAFYLAAGLGAGLVHALAHPASTVPTIGASGAIAGVLGAYLVFYPHARVTTLVPILVFFTFVELPALVVLGLWFLLQLVRGAAALGVADVSGVAWW